MYILAASITVAVLVPVSIALSGFGPKATKGFYNNSPSSIPDTMGDARLISQQVDGEARPILRLGITMISQMLLYKRKEWYFSSPSI